MADSLQIKCSIVAEEVPSSLLPGELAVNTADEELYVGDGVDVKALIRRGENERAGVAATLDAAHLVAYVHGDIAHTNRTALNLVSGTNTGDQDLSGLAPASKGVTNGDNHDHSGGDGAQIDHGALAGRADDDHAQYLLLAGRAGGQTIVRNAIGASINTTTGHAIKLENTTLGTSGAKSQAAPAVNFAGQYWDGSTSQPMLASIGLEDNGAGTNATFSVKLKRGAASEALILKIDSYGQFGSPLKFNSFDDRESLTLGFQAGNDAPATASYDQYSPYTKWFSMGWKTAATAGSQYMSLGQMTAPEQGVISPIGVHKWFYGINTGNPVEANELLRLQWGSDSGVLGAIFNKNNIAGYTVGILGNTGLGTTSPSGRLDVHGSGTTTGVCFQTADSTGAAKFTILDNGAVSASNQITSTLAAGTSPFAVSSPTLNTNLNAELWNGKKLVTGSGTLTAGTSTTVTIAGVTASSIVLIQPTSAGITTLGVYVSAKNSGNFVLSHLLAAGTETFDYIIIN